tara:strand:+ start:3920 stop:4465 length:546 start_codon:yes stop_codon:yes gene_type:complete
MVLTAKAYEAFFATSGGGATEIDNTTLTNIESAWNTEKADGCRKYVDDPIFAPIIFQLQKMQDEIDYLRTEVDANKNKASFPGFGNKNIQALAGDTTTISSSQASAITANTAKTSMSLGTSGSTALAGNTNIVTIGSSTTISFGDMITTVTGKPPKTTTTYSIVMTVTNGGVSKSTTLTLT